MQQDFPKKSIASPGCKGGAPLHQLIQGVLHDVFVLRVQGWGGFVQDQQPRLLEKNLAILV